MKITTELRNLKVGTIVYSNYGDFFIDSEYDPKTDTYIFRNVDLDPDGCISFGRIHPYEMIGCEIF